MSNKQELGERHMKILGELIAKGEKEACFNHLLELDDEEFGAAAVAMTDKALEGDSGLTMIFERASARRYHKRLQRGGELYDKYLSLDSDQEREAFRKILHPENKQLLDEVIWNQRTGSEAFIFLMKKSIRPTPGKAIAAVAAGGLATTGAAVSGVSTAPAIGVGVGTALLTEVIITGFEEDEATKKIGKSLRALLIDKPKSWLGRLVAKQEG